MKKNDRLLFEVQVFT